MSSRGDFWSRRKAAVEAEARAELKVQEAADSKGAEAAVEAQAAEKTDAEVLEELGLPDPETMTMGDDFSVFLKAALPERIKRRALRQLWRSNPVLACVDGLNDYDGDFTGDGLQGGALQTAYQVGRGMVKQLSDLTEGDQPSEGTDHTARHPHSVRPPGDSPAALDDHPGETLSEMEGDGCDMTRSEPADPDHAEGPRGDVNANLAQPSEEQTIPLNRRMRFRFLD